MVKIILNQFSQVLPQDTKNILKIMVHTNQKALFKLAFLPVLGVLFKIVSFGLIVQTHLSIYFTFGKSLS